MIRKISAIFTIFTFMFIFAEPSLLHAVVWPISNLDEYFADTATSPFGPRNIGGVEYEYDFHEGLDLRAPEGTEVHSIAEGKVDEVKWDDNAGNIVKIHHGVWGYSEYFHLKSNSIYVSEGQQVAQGDVVALSGQTGARCAGPHLHLGVIEGYTPTGKRKNPVGFLPYNNSGDPWIFWTYMDPLFGDYIDYLVVGVSTPHDELDLNIIKVYLYHGSEVKQIEMNFNLRYSVDNSTGYFVHFEDDQIFETTVKIEPTTFNPLSPQQLYFYVNPTNNEAFPQELVELEPKWIGIYFEDLGGYSSSWGNVSGSPVISILSSFQAFSKAEKIEIKWSVVSSYLVKGFNLYRSTDERSDYTKINRYLFELNSKTEGRSIDFSFIDDDVCLGIKYYYKLQQVNKDNTTEFLPDVASTTVISHFSLNQNYPNPFNSSTVICFALGSKKPEVTTLRIYNILGQEVRTLADDLKSAGIYHITWDGKDNNGDEVSSGVYFYVLKSENRNEMKKMLLIK